MLMTSSEVFADILSMTTSSNNKGRHVQFVAETGRLEFLMFGSAASVHGKNNPKRVQKTLADITGY